MSLSWVPYSLFGALIYGSMSFSLGFVSPKIKKSLTGQMGYGFVYCALSGLLSIIALLGLKTHMSKDINTMISNIDVRVLALTAILNMMVNPIHAVVMNEGGSVGQQTMYSLAIIPVLVGEAFFYGEKLSIKQIIGIILAGGGAYLMASGRKRSE